MQRYAMQRVFHTMPHMARTTPRTTSRTVWQHAASIRHRQAKAHGGYVVGAARTGANELIERSEVNTNDAGAGCRVSLLFVVVDRKQRVLLRKHQQEVLIKSLKQVQRSFPSQSNPTTPKQNT